MRTPGIAIGIEAGEWPPERVVRRLAGRAVEAIVAELTGGRPHAPSTPGLGWDTEISILFTDDAAMRRLNARWRGKDKPTNVLSFPQAAGPWLSPLPPPPRLRRTGPHPPPEEERAPALLGDIVLAAETVRREAALAEKSLEDHLSHLIIHGFLHLLGYDHEAEDEAEEMEKLERAALSRMGIADPSAAPRT